MTQAQPLDPDEILALQVAIADGGAIDLKEPDRMVHAPAVARLARRGYFEPRAGFFSGAYRTEYEMALTEAGRAASGAPNK